MTQTEPSDAPPDNAAIVRRQALMKLCALANEAELQQVLNDISLSQDVRDLRAPQTGLVMLRGQTGGNGAAFNVGEATVTRAVVRLATGETGYGYVLGRAAGRARLAAVVDALGQRPDVAECLMAALHSAVTVRLSAETARMREETAATRVNFFTLVRGED